MKKKILEQKFKKVLKIFSILCGVILLFCIIGAIWNNISLKREADKFPPEGVMVDVIDSKIHVFITGERREEDDPVIVLISGLSTSSPVADFSPIWQRLNEEYCVVVLERPGYGWSEPTKQERTIENIVEEDIIALKNADIDPPYVLAAHSVGGIEAHYFSASNKDDVKGILLLDCMSPDLYLYYGKQSIPFLNKILSPLRTVGLLRFLDTVSPNTVTKISRSERNNFLYVDSHYSKIDRVMMLKSSGEKNMLDETKMRYKNAETASKVSIPSNIPVTLVIPNLAESEEYAGYKEYMDYEMKWINQSSNGKIVDLKGGHYIHQYDPEGVCVLIRELVNNAEY